MAYLGDFTTANTVYVYFNTFNSAGASITLTGLATTDIEIYKDGGTTQRASEAGYTLLDTDGIDFDGITGIHGFKIDLSDNTDSGFYAAGHEYTVVVASVTVDSQTVNFVAAEFSIERAGGALALIKAGVTLGATQGAIEWGQQKISANIADEGALHIVNSNASGHGMHNEGAYGQYNYGPGGYGQYNNGTEGQRNEGTEKGQSNSGDEAGIFCFSGGGAGLYAQGDNGGGAGYGIQALGGLADTDPDWSGSGATAQDVWEYETRELTALDEDNTTIDLDASTIGTVTTVTNGVTLADDAITAAKFDESTAFPLKADDSGDTYIARTGADSDTLETLSDQIDLQTASVVQTGDSYGFLTTALTESYAADGAAPTLAQFLYGIWSFLFERSVSGTTVTCAKLDGSTTSMTFTLNDATAPTSITKSG